MKLRDLSLPLLLAIGFSLSDPCAPSSREEADQPKPEDPVYEVKTIYPRFEESPRYVGAVGTFFASDRLSLAAEFDGNVEKVYVGEGDTVNVGDPLCLFKSENLNAEIEKKQAELKEAEAQLELDRRNFELRTGEPAPPPLAEPLEEPEPVFVDEEMPEKPVPPRPENQPLGRPPSQAVDLEAKIELDEATVERLAKELDSLEEKLKKLTVGASIAGVIVKKQITEGDIVRAGNSLFEIVTIDPITFTFGIPQEVASYVDKMTLVTASPLSAPDMTLTGTIFYISPEINPTTKTLEVKAHLPNDKGLIKEGQQGKALVATRKVEKILMVQREALVTEGDKNYVYVVFGNKAHKTPVEIRAELGQGNEVGVDADIRIDDVLVIFGAQNLKDKSFVKVVSEPPPEPALNTITKQPVGNSATAP
ncbi:MAG: efflux RND transporter periplasmic adaptor subunit [Deltaproteobacteria bacterium]|nr:efflux RND transporter periplasmic adaptor subunit [Deltaproteobacteria bacterium]